MAVETDAFSVIEGIVAQARRKVRAAMQVVGDELLHELKVEVSTFCPVYPDNPPGAKHSTPYAYPYEESGDFRGNLYTTVEDGNRFISLKLWSHTRKGHGKFLNEGTTKMKPRPWGELILVKKNWTARIAEVARAIE